MDELDKTLRSILMEVCEVISCSICHLLTPIDLLGVYIGSNYFQGAEFIKAVPSKNFICVKCFKVRLGRIPVSLTTLTDIAELDGFRDLVYGE